MALVETLLRAAHAHGTHHQLALDALTSLPGESWRRVFYKHIAVYLDGAKAPDKAFKDFQNHVLHARDGFWGGAPAQARVWYGETVTALQRQDWPAAAYAAGVLSHYCTDPVMPLHTHQTDAESNIHAALEWSVSRSYKSLHALGGTLAIDAPPLATGAADWLGDLLRAEATEATRHYETLLAHYDFKRGVVVPEEGLDLVGQRAIAGQLVRAERMYGAVLARAIVDAGVAAPEVSLAGDALQAFLTMPKSWWTKRGLDASERRVIEAMYDELMATGAVRATLGEDERRIRELYAAELLSRRAADAAAGSADAATRNAPAPTGPIEDETNADPVEAADSTIPVGRRGSIERPRPAPAKTAAPEARTAAHTITADEPAQSAVVALAPSEPVQPATLPPALSLAAAVVAPAALAPPESAVTAPTLSTYRPAARSAAKARLAVDNDIVDAPSIGPKTAQRLNTVGIDTVGDFLKAHPIALEARLEARHLTADVLAAWQDQCRLMLTLPDLKAVQAQIIVGAGYRSVDALASADADKLCADVLHYVLTPDGQRLLREGHAPDITEIRGWAQSARAVKAA